MLQPVAVSPYKPTFHRVFTVFAVYWLTYSSHSDDSLVCTQWMK